MVAGADDALSVGVLTGAGGTFCAGADLSEQRSESDGEPAAALTLVAGLYTWFAFRRRYERSSPAA